MLLSAASIWRHRTLDDVPRRVPRRRPGAAAASWCEQLDDRARLARVAGRAGRPKETGNPRTVGWRFDPRRPDGALVRAAGDDAAPARRSPEARGEPLRARDGRLRRRARPASAALPLRANPWSEGDGLGSGLAARRRRHVAGDGRVLRTSDACTPSGCPERARTSSRLAGVRPPRSRADETGAAIRDRPPRRGTRTTSSRRSRGGPVGARGSSSPADALGARVRERTVADMVAEAERLGGEVDAATARRSASRCRRRSRTRSAVSGRRGPRAGRRRRRALGRRSRRRRHRHRRLRERPRGGARPRPSRGGVGG